MQEVEITADGVTLPGYLEVPGGARGTVVFAHGSGSSRDSPRNRTVAETLNDEGLATLLFDLLTEAESADRGNVFDIDLLAARLRAATSWVRQHGETAELPLGYFGASTGAAAALVAAADEPGVGAVVSRGGRPDMAIPRLPAVSAPTLLVVGGRDTAVIGMNEEALGHLAGPNELEIVEGATHLFEEPGALEEVADLAADWFLRHLTGG